MPPETTKNIIYGGIIIGAIVVCVAAAYLILKSKARMKNIKDAANAPRIDLWLKRTYHTNGTNGELSVNGVFHCYTIELPDKGNQNRVSCIPEGVYDLVRHKSAKLGDVILLQDVPNRSMIYIHSANNAQKELLGCIAPVTVLTGQGTGTASRAVFEPLREVVYAALAQGKPCTIRITK